MVARPRSSTLAILAEEQAAAAMELRRDLSLKSLSLTMAMVSPHALTRLGTPTPAAPSC